MSSSDILSFQHISWFTLARPNIALITWYVGTVLKCFIGNQLKHACTTAALTSKGYSSSGDHRLTKCANVCWQIFMNVFKRKTKHYHQNVHGNSKIYQLFTLLLVISQIHFHQGPWDTRQKKVVTTKKNKINSDIEPVCFIGWPAYAFQFYVLSGSYRLLVAAFQ